MSNGFERALASGNFLAERLPLKAISSYYLICAVPPASGREP